MKIDILKEPEQVTIIVSGRVDTMTARDLDEETAPLFEENIKKLYLDCTCIEYVSSAGLRFFVTAHKKMEAKGGLFILSNLNRQVRSVLDLTGLSKVMNIL